MIVNWKVFLGSGVPGKPGTWRRGGAKDNKRARKVVVGIVERYLSYGNRPELIEVYFRTVEPFSPLRREDYGKPYIKVFTGNPLDFETWSETLEEPGTLSEYFGRPIKG